MTRLCKSRPKFLVLVIFFFTYLFIINAFVRSHFDSFVKSDKMVPSEIKSMIYNSYVNPDEEAKKLPHPPLVKKDAASCKYGPKCCVGDHINFSDATFNSLRSGWTNSYNFNQILQ